jgi:hypothetical protein
VENKELIDKKRLIVDLNIDTHCEVKKRAAQQNMSIKNWIEMAIVEKIKQEIHLGFE